MALLNDDEFLQEFIALYKRRLKRPKENIDKTCDLCGRSPCVEWLEGFREKELDKPFLCRNHAIGWHALLGRRPLFDRMSTEDHFARWLTNQFIKETKKLNKSLENENV